MEDRLDKLRMRLREWRPETAKQVWQVLAEVIELADCDALDLVRSRATEQEVLDILDEPVSGEVPLAGLGLVAKPRPGEDR